LRRYCANITDKLHESDLVGRSIGLENWVVMTGHLLILIALQFGLKIPIKKNKVAPIQKYKTK